jgi:hypothetical protein
MIGSRENLYNDIEVIFGAALKFVEKNKDGIIFADENGTQFQIKVTQKKTKSDGPANIEGTQPVIPLADWTKLLTLTKEESMSYEQLKEEIDRRKANVNS